MQKLENPHVISNDQVSINIIRKGVMNETFNFSYQNRDNMNTLKDVGMTISHISEATPGGILIFFPSYRLLEQCYE